MKVLEVLGGSRGLLEVLEVLEVLGGSRRFLEVLEVLGGSRKLLKEVLGGSWMFLKLLEVISRVSQCVSFEGHEARKNSWLPQCRRLTS